MKVHLDSAKLLSRVREAARKAASAAARDVRSRLGFKAAPNDRFYGEQDAIGFNIDLTKAIGHGAGQRRADDAAAREVLGTQKRQGWDLKPGILARTLKSSKKGIPYADVPIHEGHHPNRPLVRWRRVSGNSASGSWWHPGFPGIPDFPPGVEFELKFPGVPDPPVPIKPSPTPPNALEVRKRGVVRRVLDALPDFFRKEWRK